ncbi:uncharacterized protein RCC_06623 [Ramularia collo-cygni]|uniref:Uncharacterized protein n=1 Tax=Ramularia collo-cygni TaxID=112498 RepID=A0A2D3V211_9PEZI|nr:uncharacterized protein RCC_06623 [Ramularia collo-cygni]CZT20765.1 uncharacterized protein RCC_06623 [Ramularia collo-cygni]
MRFTIAVSVLFAALAAAVPAAEPGTDGIAVIAERQVSSRCPVASCTPGCVPERGGHLGMQFGERRKLLYGLPEDQQLRQLEDVFATVKLDPLFDVSGGDV